MILTFLFIVLSLLPTLLSAATINVISGEHADFSRLVLQFPEETKWDIGKFEGGYALSTSSKDITYSIDQVFDFIPKKRILKLEAFSDGGLKIYTQTELHLDAFELRAGRLVIDIKDGIPSENSKFEIPFSPMKKDIQFEQPDTITVNASDAMENGQPSEESSPSKATNLSIIDSIPPLLPNMMNLPAQELAENVYFSPLIDPLNEPNFRVLEMEEALFSQIGRAVSQGLLQADLPDTEQVIEAAKLPTTARTPNIEPISPRAPHDVEVYDTTHIRVQTSVDRDRTNSSHDNSIEAESCPPTNLLAIEKWGEPPSDGVILSDFRSQAIGEFDQPIVEGVENLAKYYLYLSFGAEAKSVLDEFGVFVKHAELFRLIADVMDDGYSDRPDLLAQYANCSGATGFFAAMSQQKFNPQRDHDNLEVAAYFSSLPLHLRQHLGPRLSERFLSANAIQTAKLIQHAVSRAEGIHGDAYELLTAEMRIFDGNINEAIEILDVISSQDGTVSADALIRAIEIRAAQNMKIDPETAELAAILTIEHRGSPLEEALTRASITAQIYSANPGRALATLSHKNTMSLLPPAVQKKLTNEAAVEIVSSFADIAFAKEAVFLLETNANKQLTDSSKIQIADRMMHIGFSDLALKFLNIEGDLDDQTRVILGKIARSQRRDNEALSYLINIIDQPEVARIRAEIYLDLNMPQKSAKEFQLASQLEAANNANLISENWDALSSSTDKSLASLADLIKGAKPSEISEEITISKAQELLKYSQSSRTLFENILN